MSFKKLIAALEAGEIDTAKDLATSLEGDFNANVQEIEKLESKASEAITGRDKVKAKLRELAEKAGVDELTPEAIDGLLKKKGTDSEIEAKYKTEMDKLAKKIEEITADYDSKLGDANSRLQDTMIDKELFKLGVSANAADDLALEDIVRHLKGNVTIEDGALVYKNADGVQERNDKGRPLTLSDKLVELQEKRSYLFKATGQGGSGETHRTGGKTAQAITRSSFDAMDAPSKATFIKDGGKVTE